MSVLRLTPERYAALQKKAQQPAQNAPGRPFPASGVLPKSKYRNHATGGYASVKEARRAAELKLMLAAGAIMNLREQVPFLLLPAQYDLNGKLLERQSVYIADFVYDHGGKMIVEDVKGLRKGEAYALFTLKRKLMLFLHGISVSET